MAGTAPPTESRSPPLPPSEKEDGEAAAACASGVESKAQDPSPLPQITATAAASTSTSGATDDDGDHAADGNTLGTKDESLNNASSSSAPEPPRAPPAPQLPLHLPADDPDDPDDAAALDRDFLSLLPPCLLPRIGKLKALNERRDDLLEQYRCERAALEVKFNVKIQPLYEERQGVVCGTFDRSIAKAVEEAGVVDDASGGEDAAGGQGAQDVKGIPQFWACAMGHVDVIAELITEADVDCLDHLTDITCTDFPDGLGFELHFHFSPSNPFFTNCSLNKRYEVPNLLTEDEPILKNVTGTIIDWKPEQSLTFRQITKKQRKKGGANAGRIRTISKKERTESFFHFFTPPKMPGLMDVIDEEEADAVEEAFDHDYDVAQAFRGHLIPKAVLWFTGEAMIMDELEEETEEMAMAAAAEQQHGNGDVGMAGGNLEGSSGPFPPPTAGEGENPECSQN